MGKLPHKLKSEVRTHKIAKNTIWRKWGRGYAWTMVMVGDWRPASKLQGRMSSPGVEAYGRRSRRPGWRRDSHRRYPWGQCSWHPPRPWQRPPSFCSYHSCQDGSCHDDGGCYLGSPTSQVGRRSGECSKFRAATTLGSDSTETTEWQAEPDLDPAVADHCCHHRTNTLVKQWLIHSVQNKKVVNL
jgi:hypothetical protein